MMIPSLDDFAGTTDTAKFQTALSVGTPALLLPGRTITVTVKLAPIAPIVIIGEGRAATDLYFNVNDFGLETTATGRAVSIRDASIRGNTSNANSGGLNLYDNGSAAIRDCYISSFSKQGIRMERGVGHLLDSLRVFNCGYGSSIPAIEITGGSDTAVAPRIRTH